MWLRTIFAGWSPFGHLGPWQVRRCLDQTRSRFRTHRLSQARRRPDIRQADERRVLGHEPRGRPAGPPQAHRSDDPDRDQPAPRRPNPPSAIAQPASMKLSATTKARPGSRSTRRTASTAKPAISRTPARTSPGFAPKVAAGPTTRDVIRGLATPYRYATFKTKHEGGGGPTTPGSNQRSRNPLPLRHLQNQT